MKKNEIRVGRFTISDDPPCFVIAEIGNNHQGDLNIAIEMIKLAAECGVNAVKFQKRDVKTLYTKAMYGKPYDNEDSFGPTYGKHREFLELGWDDFVKLKKCAQDYGVEFMCTAFDFPSVDFLEKLGITSYKVASGDLTNIPFLEYIAKLNKPIFVSTGAATMEDVRRAYDAITKYNNNLCLLHTTCAYPADYPDLNLLAIQTLKKEFPEAIIGYSGHDNGILAAVIAFMLGARVVEKHFTMNRSWKGTDHKFSLEREGLRKQVRDLQRVNIALGNGKKIIRDIEKNAKFKMGKSLYTTKPLSTGHVLFKEDIAIKSPGGGLEPYYINQIVGDKLKDSLPEDTMLSFNHLSADYKKHEKAKKAKEKVTL